MKFEKSVVDKESIKKIYVSPPATELLLSPEQLEEVWPESIGHNEQFRSQIERRLTINRRIHEVISRLPRPDMSLKEAISNGLINEEQAINLYESLSDLLENGDYKRVLLYIPFEFLPSADWKIDSEVLARSIEHFKSAYMEAWRTQLHTHDVRANFEDGDVLDVESRTGDLPRVVKAAHLIPKLVENHFLEMGEVLDLMETSDDEVLKQNIKDSLLVLADLGSITDTELVRMRASDDRVLRDTADLVASFTNQNKGDEAVDRISAKPADLFGESLSRELDRIDAEKYSGITKKRAVWLRQEKKRKAISAAAGEVGAAITSRTLADEKVTELIEESTSLESKQVIILGIRNAVESVANLNLQEAKDIYARYENKLLSLWPGSVPEIQEALATTFYRLNSLGVVDRRHLAELKLPIPALAGPFSENLLSLEKEVNAMREIEAAIESDPELSKFILPAVLEFGSKVKGYGATGADIDVAVFVKPDVPFEERKKIKQALKSKFKDERVGEIVEFWLEETSAGLRIRDFDQTDVSLGESYWTHVLFGAAWLGKKETIKELREKLLVSYFYDTEKVIHGRPARGLYLEELERDTLQYRLMHKGYARFFAPCGGIKTPHANYIDGESMFWDSGYRQLALRLFARRVFLPKLQRES